METVFIGVTETLLFCQFSILLFASRRVCVRARVQPVFLDGRKYLKILFQLVFPPDSEVHVRLVCFMAFAREMVRRLKHPVSVWQALQDPESSRGHGNLPLPLLYTEGSSYSVQ